MSAALGTAMIRLNDRQGDAIGLRCSHACEHISRDMLETTLNGMLAGVAQAKPCTLQLVLCTPKRPYTERMRGSRVPCLGVPNQRLEMLDRPV